MCFDKFISEPGCSEMTLRSQYLVVFLFVFFSSRARIFGVCLTNHSLPAIFSFFFNGD